MCHAYMQIVSLIFCLVAQAYMYQIMFVMPYRLEVRLRSVSMAMTDAA